MNSNLLDFVLTNLRRRDRPWVEVAKSTGVPYDTLKKIANGVTPNPGVKHVQALADYFISKAPAANDASAAQAEGQGVAGHA